MELLVGVSLVLLTAWAKRNGLQWGNKRLETTPPWAPWGSTHPDLHTHSTHSNELPRHGLCVLVEVVLPKAGILPCEFWFYLGDDAASFHNSAEGDAWKQRTATHADIGSQQAIYQSPRWGEPERDGRTLRRHHDGIRWVLSCIRNCILSSKFRIWHLIILIAPCLGMSKIFIASRNRWSHWNEWWTSWATEMHLLEHSITCITRNCNRKIAIFAIK